MDRKDQGDKPATQLPALIRVRTCRDPRPLGMLPSGVQLIRHIQASTCGLRPICAFESSEKLRMVAPPLPMMLPHSAAGTSSRSSCECPSLRHSAPLSAPTSHATLPFDFQLVLGLQRPPKQKAVPALYGRHYCPCLCHDETHEVDSRHERGGWLPSLQRMKLPSGFFRNPPAHPSPG